jgi:hypothetical protein
MPVFLVGTVFTMEKAGTVAVVAVVVVAVVVVVVVVEVAMGGITKDGKGMVPSVLAIASGAMVAAILAVPVTTLPPCAVRAIEKTSDSMTAGSAETTSHVAFAVVPLGKS